MRTILITLLTICTVSACTTSYKYNVTLQDSEYQLSQEKTIEPKLNQLSINSLIPVNTSNELLIDTGSGAEFLDSEGKFKSTYNQQPSEQIDTMAILLAHRIVGSNLILSYTDHVATLGLPNNDLISKLEKPSLMEETSHSSISPDGRYLLAFGYLWDYKEKKKLGFFNPDQLDRVAGISAEFSPNNRYLVLSVDSLTETRSQLWDVQNGSLKNNWRLDGFASALFTPDSELEIFILEKRHPYSKQGENPQLVAYDVATGAKTGNIQFSNPLSFPPIIIDDEHIVSAHQNGDLHVWSYRDFNAVYSYHGQSAVTSMIKDTKSRVWCGFEDGTLLVIENGRFSLVHTFKSHIVHLAVLGNRLFVELFSQPGNHLGSYEILQRR